MENPVDHTLDLGFVNYVQHPENKDYVVFRFMDKNRADAYREALKEKDIWFEEASEPKRTKIQYMFGVHHRDFKVAQQLNFKVEGEHKKPFIPYNGLRWLVIFFSLTAITLAIVGYIKAQQHLKNQTELVQ